MEIPIYELDLITVHGAKKYKWVEVIVVSWIRKYPFSWLRSKIFLSQENMYLSQGNFLNFSWFRKIFDLSQENGYFLIQDTSITSTYSHFFAPWIECLKLDAWTLMGYWVARKCRNPSLFAVHANYPSFAICVYKFTHSRLSSGANFIFVIINFSLWL